ncbi:MAG: phage holin family protein [Oscillospiraceae bacterium]|nr:phage holin family protein [Oscillospiraceae bacterium]
MVINMNGRTAFETLFAVAGGLAGFLFGAADGLFYALVAFAVLDYVTGVTSALIKKELSSRVGFEGLFKKVMVFVLVALANIIDRQVLGGTEGVLRSAVVAFLLANEGLSILENISKAGLPVPKKLRAMLKQIKEDNDFENKSG